MSYWTVEVIPHLYFEHRFGTGRTRAVIQCFQASGPDSYDTGGSYFPLGGFDLSHVLGVAVIGQTQTTARGLLFIPKPEGVGPSYSPHTVKMLVFRDAPQNAVAQDFGEAAAAGNYSGVVLTVAVFGIRGANSEYDPISGEGLASDKSGGGFINLPSD